MAVIYFLRVVYEEMYVTQHYPRSSTHTVNACLISHAVSYILCRLSFLAHRYRMTYTSVIDGQRIAHSTVFRIQDKHKANKINAIVLRKNVEPTTSN